jgi:hypothetical protein
MQPGKQKAPEIKTAPSNAGQPTICKPTRSEMVNARHPPREPGLKAALEAVGQKYVAKARELDPPLPSGDGT